VRTAAIIGLVLALNSGAATANDLCFRNLKDKRGETAKLPNISVRQSRAMVIPNFSWLVIDRALIHENNFYTVRGMTFEPLAAQFLDSWDSGTSFISRADGSVIGFSYRPNRLWKLDPGGEDFRTVENVPPYKFGDYDPATDTVYLAADDGSLFEIQSSGPVLSALSGLDFPRPYGLPRFFSELRGHLAANDEGLWFRAGVEADWAKIPGEIDENLLMQASLTGVLHSEGENLLAIPTGSEWTVVSAEVGKVPVILYSVAISKRPVQVGSQIIAWHEPPEPTFIRKLFDPADHLSKPATLVRLTRSGPVQLGDSAILGAYTKVGDTAEPLLIHRIVSAKDSNLALIDTGRARLTFDGVNLTHRDDLSVSLVGEFPEVVHVMGRSFLKTTKGLFSVGPEFSVIPVLLPFATDQRLEVLDAPNLGGVLLTEPLTSNIWFTRDMKTFQRVIEQPNVHGIRAVAEVPGRKAVLAMTQIGPAIIVDCVSGG
jgi:hypothetical protein